MIVEATIQGDLLPDSTVDVDQESECKGIHQSNQIVSAPAALSFAFVDRTADPTKAAESILCARLAFRGKSPYAPDVVLVNEFARQKFLQALVHALHSVQAGSPDQDDHSPAMGPRKFDLQRVRSDMQRTLTFKMISETDRGAIFQVNGRASSFILTKVQDPCLIVHSVRSLDDAIDFANSGHTLLAAYHFAELKAAKYLSQFVKADVSFVNGIPAAMLVGPAYPLGHPVDPSLRYTPTMFSRPRPSYVTSTPAAEIASVVTLMSSRTTHIDKLLTNAGSGLPIRKRAKQDTTAFGFFEHALLLHLGLVAMLGLTATGAAVAWAIRHR